MRVLIRIIDLLLEGKDPADVQVSLVQPTETVFYADDEHKPIQARARRKEIIEHDVSYAWLNWVSDVYPKPTEQEFMAIVERAHLGDYQEQRREAYPSVEQQLDTLYHEGYEGWRATVEAVKQQFPKPEV